jgi:hypothetical protein
MAFAVVIDFGPAAVAMNGVSWALDWSSPIPFQQAISPACHQARDHALHLASRIYGFPAIGDLSQLVEVTCLRG